MEQQRSSAKLVLLIVLGILIAAGVIWLVRGTLETIGTNRHIEADKKRRAEDTAVRIARAVVEYMGSPQNPAKTFDNSMPKALSQLVNPPFGGSSFLPNGDADLFDPWGNPFQFRREGDSFLVFTTAPDSTPISHHGIGPASKVAP